MRIALALVALILVPAAWSAESNADKLAAALAKERTGELNDASKPGAEQIEAAEVRFEAYFKLATTRAERDAISAAFDAVCDKITDRLKAKVEKLRETRRRQLEIEQDRLRRELKRRYPPKDA